MKDLLHFNLEEKNCLYDKSTNICIQLHIACMLMTEMQMGTRGRSVIELHFISNRFLLIQWVSFMSGFLHLEQMFFLIYKQG